MPTRTVPTTTGHGTTVNRAQDHAVVVTCDSHAGPLLKEQMRQYCPASHLQEFDEFADQATSSRLPSGLALRERVEADPRAGAAASWDNSLTDGGWDMTARLHDMNYDGIAAEIIFHGLNAGRVEPMPFGGMFGMEPDDKELVGLGRHMYNQWLADFVSMEPERHAGLCHLPMWDVDGAVEEMEWAREAGLRGINFPRPQAGLLPYNHPDWEPFWSAAEALEMPLSTHAQSDGGPGSFASPGQGNLLIGILEVTGYAARRALHYLVYGGVFDRHPGLKLVFTEQPGEWWRPMLDEMDSLYLMPSRSLRPRWNTSPTPRPFVRTHSAATTRTTNGPPAESPMRCARSVSATQRGRSDEQGRLQLEAGGRDHEREAEGFSSDGYSVDQVRPAAQGWVDVLEALQVNDDCCPRSGADGAIELNAPGIPRRSQ
jgi:predicted TIM-barrel fold metal-dependent hydrolase